MSSENASPARSPATTADEIAVEKTFEVDGTPDQAWEKLERLTAEHDPGPGTWWLPGFRCRATEVAAAAGHRLEVVRTNSHARTRPSCSRSNTLAPAPGST